MSSSGSSGGLPSRRPEPPSSPVFLGDRSRLLRGLDASRHRRTARRGIEERQRVDPETEHRHAERLEQLGSRRDVEQRLDAGRDDERRRSRELGEIGRDVGRMGEAAMDAADAAGRENPDPGGSRNRKRAADGRGADGALNRSRREVARPGLPRLRPEASQLLRSQPDAHLSVEDADRRRNRTRLAHLPLGLETDLDAFAGREAVRHERRLERDDSAARGERFADLFGDADHADSSISAKRLSSLRRTSWKPARRYARSARSFQRATQSRNVRGRHSRRAYSSPASMNG